MKTINQILQATGYKILNRLILCFFPFISNPFSSDNKTFRIDNKSFTVVNKTFTVVNKTFTVVNKPFTVVNKTFTVFSKMFSVVNKVFIVFGKSIIVGHSCYSLFKMLVTPNNYSINNLSISKT